MLCKYNILIDMVIYCKNIVTQLILTVIGYYWVKQRRGQIIKHFPAVTESCHALLPLSSNHLY